MEFIKQISFLLLIILLSMDWCQSQCSIGLYDCENQCIPMDLPCNGTCGSIYQHICDNKCIGASIPCHGKCSNQIRPFHCDGKCQSPQIPCQNECYSGFVRCSVESKCLHIPEYCLNR